MLTREQIEKEYWFGDQRGQVLELLERAERAEAARFDRAEKAEAALRIIAIHAEAFHDVATASGLAFIVSGEIQHVDAVRDSPPAQALLRKVTS